MAKDATSDDKNHDVTTNIDHADVHTRVMNIPCVDPGAYIYIKQELRIL